MLQYLVQMECGNNIHFMDIRGCSGFIGNVEISERTLKLHVEEWIYCKMDLLLKKATEKTIPMPTPPAVRIEI